MALQRLHLSQLHLGNILLGCTLTLFCACGDDSDPGAEPDASEDASAQDGAFEGDSAQGDASRRDDGAVGDGSVGEDGSVTADGSTTDDASTQKDAGNVTCSNPAQCADYEACLSCIDSRCCIETGGNWTAPANSEVEQCVCPTGQEGVACDEASDCLAGCSGEPKGAPPNQCAKVTKGTCNATSIRGGCYCRFDDEPGVSTHFCLG